MSDNENLEEKSGTEELKQKQADHRPLIEKAAEAASDIEKASYKPFAGALDWAGSLVYAVLAMLLLNLFVFRSITVDGESMMNTLQNNDRVLSTNFFYTPSRGDIVVLEADRIPNQATMNYGEPIIKRVIALEGDTIKFDFENGQVFLKKAGETEFELLDEDYIAAPTVAKLDRGTSTTQYHHTYAITVPEGCVFVMGDNRNRSLDSRSLMLGDVDTDLIMGRAFVRLFPIKNFAWL